MTFGTPEEYERYDRLAMREIVTEHNAQVERRRKAERLLLIALFSCDRNVIYDSADLKAIHQLALSLHYRRSIQTALRFSAVGAFTLPILLLELRILSQTVCVTVVVIAIIAGASSLMMGTPSTAPLAKAVEQYAVGVGLLTRDA